MSEGLVKAVLVAGSALVGLGVVGLVLSFVSRSPGMRKNRSLSWLSLVIGGTALYVRWKAHAADRVTMDVLYQIYLGLGVGLAALLVGLATLNWRGFVRGTSSIWTMTRKELFGYFCSPLGYIILFDYLAIVGYLFYAHMEMPYQTVNLFQYYAFMLFFVSMLTVPMITMRLFAEEKASGTIEMLVTSPISEAQIVAGKYLAALAFFAATLIPTGIYVLLLREYAPGAPPRPEWYKLHLWVTHLFRHQEQPELGLILTSYLGVFLVGAIFVAIGTLISAMTRHQVVAGMLTLHVIFALWLLLMIATKKEWDVPENSWKDWLQEMLKYIKFETLLEPSWKGLIDSRSLIYTVSTVFFLLFMTVKTLEIRRWK